MNKATEQIKGIPLTEKPKGIQRCGMSAAHFAQHCQTQRWYQLSELGEIIGAAVELDYFRVDGQSTGTASAKEINTDLMGV